MNKKTFNVDYTGHTSYEYDKKTYYLDFDGYVEIEASSKEEAEKIFWETHRSPLPEDKTVNYMINEIGVEEK
jgi:hypothetical protein